MDERRNVLPSDGLLVTTFASLFVVMLAFNSCMEQRRDFDYRLAPHIADFEREFNVKISFTVQVMPDATFPQNQLAYCRRSVGPRGFNNNVVNVSISAVNNLSPIGLQQLIYHELAHCELGLSHEPYVDLDIAVAQGRQCPRSVMVPIHFSDECYVNYRNYYVTQLKERFNNLNLIKPIRLGAAENASDPSSPSF